MFEEVYSEILEKVSFTATDKFEDLVRKSITKAMIIGDENPNVTSVSFKFGQLLEGITYFAHSKGKENALKLGSDTILIITNALQYELDDTEAFLLFHLRNLGKFRKKESELLSELKKLWVQYPDYEMEDREFSRALKSLMRDKFIQYRKGKIHLNPAFVIRYRG